MEITHRLEEKDYVQFNLFQIQHSEKLKKRLAVQRFVVSLLFIGIALFTYVFLPRFSLLVAGIFLLISLFWYLYFPTFSKNQVVKSTEKTIASGHLSTLFDEVRLKIDTIGIEERTSRGNHLNSWSDIQSIKQTKDYLYLYMIEASALIIPKRNLKEAELKELKSLIDQYYQKAIQTIDS